MPLALLALFVGYLLINAGIRNQHPWAEIVQAFGGSPPGAPGISPGEAGSITPPGQGPLQGPPSPATTQGARPALGRIIAFAKALPGLSFGGICADPDAGGHISGSEHFDCNAVDIFGTRTALAAGFVALRTAAVARVIPVHCIIWDRNIYSRESGFERRPYSGPSAHTTHIHVSGWPSVGGEC